MLMIIITGCRLLWIQRWSLIAAGSFFTSLVIASYACSLLLRHYCLPDNQLVLGKLTITDCDRRVFAILSTIAFYYSISTAVHSYGTFIASVITVLDVILLIVLTMILTRLKKYFTDDRE